VEDDTRLGSWLVTQRKSKKRGSLNTERVTRLDKLGDWECSNRSREKLDIESQWESN